MASFISSTSAHFKMPYVVMILLQFISAGMSLLSMEAISSQGMNAYVSVVYRQVFAVIALAPFVFFTRRGNELPSLSYALLCKAVLVSSGNALSLNLSNYALNYVPATLATALVNIVPSVTFILAVLFRTEKLEIKQRHGIAKVIGSTLGLSGALLCTFVRGPAIYSDSREEISRLYEQIYQQSEWIKGSLIILAANLAGCLWLIMQDHLMKQYPCKLCLTTLQYLSSCALSAIWAVAKERAAKSWKLGWNIKLISVFYSGVIGTALSYWLSFWVVEKKGHVSSSSFGPLVFVITAILSAVLFQEMLHWGSVSGAILLVIGVYCILWGEIEAAKIEATKPEAENEEGAVFEENKQKLFTLKL